MGRFAPGDRDVALGIDSDRGRAAFAGDLGEGEGLSGLLAVGAELRIAEHRGLAHGGTEPGDVKIGGSGGGRVRGFHPGLRFRDQERLAPRLAFIRRHRVVEIVDERGVGGSHRDRSADIDPLLSVDRQAGPSVGLAGVAALGVKDPDGRRKRGAAVLGEAELDVAVPAEGDVSVPVRVERERRDLRAVGDLDQGAGILGKGGLGLEEQDAQKEAHEGGIIARSGKRHQGTTPSTATAESIGP